MALSQKVCKHYQLQNKYPGTKAEISVLVSSSPAAGLSTQTHPIHRGNRHAAKTKKQMTTPLPTGHSACPHNTTRHPWSLLWLHLFHVMLLSKRLKLQGSWKFKWNNATKCVLQSFDQVINFCSVSLVITVQKKPPVFGLDCKIIEYQTSFLFMCLYSMSLHVQWYTLVIIQNPLILHENL